MQIPFTKMHGLGNDFVVLDLINHPAEIEPERVRALADRHFGIGFDQLLVVEPPSDPRVDFNFRIFNSDGNEVEHCGNGARCLANFVHDKGLTTRNPIQVKTVNRVLSLERTENHQVSVDMGAPEFEPARIPFRADSRAALYSRQVETQVNAGGKPTDIEFSALSMGNPHAVIVVEDLEQTAVKDIGEAVAAHPDFPEGVNVGFMQILSRGEIRLRVYERGVGETLACGTGACAAVVAGCLNGLLNDTVKVSLPGGQLTVHWRYNQQYSKQCNDKLQENDSSVLMTGPTATVYEGTIEL